VYFELGVQLLMADPLSVTASIIAVIQLAGKITSICSEYLYKVKEAPKEIKSILHEVRGIGNIMGSIQSLTGELSNSRSVTPALSPAPQRAGCPPG